MTGSGVDDYLDHDHIERMVSVASGEHQYDIPDQGDDELLAEEDGNTPDYGGEGADNGDLGLRLDRLERLALGEQSQQPVDPGDARDYLANIEAQTRQAVFDAAQYDPTPTQPEQVLAEAFKFAAETQPDFEQNGLAIRDLLQEK